MPGSGTRPTWGYDQANSSSSRDEGTEKRRLCGTFLAEEASGWRKAVEGSDVHMRTERLEGSRRREVEGVISGGIPVRLRTQIVVYGDYSQCALMRH